MFFKANIEMLSNNFKIYMHLQMEGEIQGNVMRDI